MRVPDSWRTVALAQVIQPHTERATSSANPGLPFFGMEHVEAHSGRIIGQGRSEDITSLSPVVQRGDVMYGRLRPYLNKVAVAPKEALVSGEFIVFRGNDHIDARWLKWRLTSEDFVEFAVSLNTGDRPRVKWPQMAAFEFSLPRLDEQRRIVEILEDHLSRLDAGARCLFASSARLGALVEGLVGSSEEVESSRTVMLADILAKPLRNGKSVPTADVGFPVLRLTAIRDGVMDLSERKTGKWTSSEAAPFLVSENDVFVARGNGSLKLVGRAARVAYAPDPVAFPDTMIRIRPNPDAIRADYLTAIWNSQSVRRQIEAIARTTAGIYKVNQGDLSRVRLPLPSLELQQRLITRVEDLSCRIRATTEEVKKARRRAESLRRALLSAAFRGKLTGASSDMDRVEGLASEVYA